MTTLYEHAGGHDGIHRFVDTFYASLLTDPVLRPLFGDGNPEHIVRLTAFDSESFGGPDTFSRELGGFAGLIAAHRGLRITEEQRARFVELYLAAADTAGLPADAPFRQALREHVEFGSRVAPRDDRRRAPPAARGAPLDVAGRHLTSAFTDCLRQVLLCAAWLPTARRTWPRDRNPSGAHRLLQT